MSEIYSPSGNAGTLDIRRATSGEAATGTHGQEFMRDNITRILDRIRYMRDAGVYASPGGAVISPKDPPYNAVGDATADDTTPLDSAIIDASGKCLLLPSSAGYRRTSQLTVPAKTLIKGDGRGSLLKTTTLSTHLVGVATPGAVLRALALQGLKGTTVLNNSAIMFAGATDGLAEDCEAFGMSGDALFATSSDHIGFYKNYVHGLTPDATYGNSASMALYTDALRCVAAFNRLMGGAQTEVGILLQLNSIKHLVVGNEIGAHYSYGILDYDTTPRHTNNIIVLNRIEDIDGSANGAFTKGAGVYTASTGGQIIALNQIANTNINTTDGSLAPGAIGLNAPFSPVHVAGNMIWQPNWYGILVTTSVAAIVELNGNHVFEALKVPIYVRSSSHVSIIGGSITALTATPKTVNGVAVNVAGGGPFRNVSVKGVHIRGTGQHAIETGSTDKVTVSQNQISETNGGGIKVANGDAGIVSDNNVDVTTAAASPALTITNMTNSTFKGNVLKSTSTTCVVASGTNTGSVFDETNILVGMDMNNVDNQGPGCRFTLYGTAAPVLKNHQVGDRVINKAPAVGSPKAWVCTVAGLPGTWVSEGNL